MLTSTSTWLLCTLFKIKKKTIAEAGECAGKITYEESRADRILWQTLNLAIVHFKYSIKTNLQLDPRKNQKSPKRIYFYLNESFWELHCSLVKINK